MKTTKQEINRFNESYALGDKAYRECPRAMFEIEELNKILYAQQVGISAKETTDKFPEHDCKFCKDIKEPRFLFRKTDFPNAKSWDEIK